MTADGVMPLPKDRQPRRYTQTGVMDAGDGHIVFGAERGDVVILCDGGDIVLGPPDQDIFARHLFRAMNAAEVYLAGTEVPF